MNGEGIEGPGPSRLPRGEFWASVHMHTEDRVAYVLGYAAIEKKGSI